MRLTRLTPVHGSYNLQAQPPASRDRVTQPDGPNFSGPDELVTIVVGEESKSFIIHKEVASYSPVLKAAFDSDFLEGQTQTYNLEEASIEAFQLVTQWLYRQAINPVFTADEFDSLNTLPINTILPDTAQQKIVARQTHLIEAYEIGDYLQLPRLQNLMLDELEGLRVRWRTISVVSLYDLYERPSQGYGLRELVFEQCRYFIDREFFTVENKGMFPKEFLLDCVRADRNIHSQVDPFTDKDEFRRRFHVPEE
ncbi:hypothetical protein L207DRAFT_583558 [Hyaloscypha variabilis F]|uniref:BTB domain-containing protein n=1 Tax=Hyaloscypha variabilis (strain UAMH 11265 / GT02V1 / F) TaxID=1149755 RepID=A0A2J6RMG2_HYAVF|nr:hypothetical protein L207DRAFT_583558 [Hyaloscypha variabilis F]